MISLEELIDILSGGSDTDHAEPDALPYYIIVRMVQAQRWLYSAPVVAASSITAAPPFPSGHGTAEVVDRPRCDIIVVGRLPTSPSTAVAAVAVVVDGGSTLP